MKPGKHTAALNTILSDDEGYYHLQKGDIIREGDEVDACADSWRDLAKWVPVHPDSVGQPAPDPAYVAHPTYRRRTVLANPEPTGAKRPI